MVWHAGIVDWFEPKYWHGTYTYHHCRLLKATLGMSAIVGQCIRLHAWMQKSCCHSTLRMATAKGAVAAEVLRWALWERRLAVQMKA